MQQQLDLIHHELLEITQYIFQNDFDQLVMHDELKKIKTACLFKVGQELSSHQHS